MFQRAVEKLDSISMLIYDLHQLQRHAFPMLKIILVAMVLQEVRKTLPLTSIPLKISLKKLEI